MSALLIAGLVLLAFVAGLAVGVRWTGWRYQRALGGYVTDRTP